MAAEINQLKDANQRLQNDVSSWKASKQELEERRAQKDKATDLRLTEAEAAVAKANAAKEASVAKMQMEMDQLRTTNQSLEHAVQSLRSAKEELEAMALQKDKLAEARVVDAAQTAKAAQAAQEQIAHKLQLENGRLQTEKIQLEKAVCSWRAAKDELAKALATKEQEVEARIAEAHAAAREEKTEKEALVSKLQAEIACMAAEKTALEDSVNSWRRAKDQLEVNSDHLIEKAEKALAEATEEKQSLVAKLLTVLPRRLEQAKKVLPRETLSVA